MTDDLELRLVPAATDPSLRSQAYQDELRSFGEGMTASGIEFRPRMSFKDSAGKGREGMLLRISVNTKGCSGLSYQMDWVDAPGTGDEVVNDKGLTVLVDRKASLFLIGTEMDYEVKALTSGFTFNNPNEKGRCGCGESFHI